MKHRALPKACLLLCVALLLAGCGKLPVKENFVLNYVPSPPASSLRSAPYPFVVRLRDFDIEDAYARSQIVYRKSPYELQYYTYKVWAVKPFRMVTDLVYKHLLSAGLVSAIVRRFDEEAKPDYEMRGRIEAIEEYDNEQVWFAHLALHIQFRRLSDGRLLYDRRFDNRKRVYENQPQYVVKELSQIMEYVMNQLVTDLEGVLAREQGMSGAPEPAAHADPDSAADTPELWKR